MRPKVDFWLDDHHSLLGTRKTAPKGWVGVASVEELQRIVEDPGFTGIGKMSFDWHLGDDQPTGMMAMELLAKMTEERRDPKFWPEMISVHTDHLEWRPTMILFARQKNNRFRQMFPLFEPA